MTSRLASVTFKMASKVLIEESDKISILSRKYCSDFLDLGILRFLLSYKARLKYFCGMKCPVEY